MLVQNAVLDEIYAYLIERPSCSMDFSFDTEEALENSEAMGVFLERHELHAYVVRNLGSMVFLSHPAHDMQIIIESDGHGDDHSHTITVYMNHST